MAALAFTEMSSAALKGHPFLQKLIVDSLEVARDVIEDGYDPEAIEREDYIVQHNEEGELVVQFLEQ